MVHDRDLRVLRFFGWGIHELASTKGLDYDHFGRRGERSQILVMTTQKPSRG
jgi:hypothetical protein